MYPSLICSPYAMVTSCSASSCDSVGGEGRLEEPTKRLASRDGGRPLQHPPSSPRLLLQLFTLPELADLVTRLPVAAGRTDTAVDQPPARPAHAAPLPLSLGHGPRRRR